MHYSSIGRFFSETFSGALQGMMMFALPPLVLFTFGIFIHLGSVTEWIQMSAYVWPTSFLFFGMYFSAPNRLRRLSSSVITGVYGTLCVPFSIAIVSVIPFSQQYETWAIHLFLVLVAALIVGKVLARTPRERVYYVVIPTIGITAPVIALLAFGVSSYRFDYSVAMYRSHMTDNAWLILAIWTATGAIIGALLAHVPYAAVVPLPPAPNGPAPVESDA